MADPDPLTQYPLYISDKEIAARVGVCHRTWAASLRKLESEGLPRKNPDFANKRFWPAVVAFLAQREDRRKMTTSERAEREIEHLERL